MNKIEDAEKRCGLIEVNNKKYKVLFMVRVKISKIIRIEDNKNNFWVLDNKYIRIYRVIFKEIKYLGF